MNKHDVVVSGGAETHGLEVLSQLQALLRGEVEFEVPYEFELEDWDGDDGRDVRGH